MSGLWQSTYTRVRPHSSLGYRPPEPASYPDLALQLPLAGTMHQPRNWPDSKYRSGQDLMISRPQGVGSVFS